MDIVLQQQRPAMDYENGFRLLDGETLAGAIALQTTAAARTEAIITDIDDLAQAVPVPKGVPWFPQDVDAWSVRWVLLHLIQETRRPCGHGS